MDIKTVILSVIVSVILGGLLFLLGWYTRKRPARAS